MKILVAIDGSNDAMKGCELAVQMAKAQKAEIWLVAIIPAYPGIDLEITARARDHLENKLSSQAEQALNKAKEICLTAGITPQTMLISSGAIADEIVSMAETEKMDLIIIGSRGLGATGRFSLGGTAMKIVSQAPCSVLVAKAVE
jgi:nucleotide-binding universal stress UspA family protein